MSHNPEKSSVRFLTEHGLSNQGSEVVSTDTATVTGRMMTPDAFRAELDDICADAHRQANEALDFTGPPTGDSRFVADVELAKIEAALSPRVERLTSPPELAEPFNTYLVMRLRRDALGEKSARSGRHFPKFAVLGNRMMKVVAENLGLETCAKRPG